MIRKRTVTITADSAGANVSTGTGTVGFGEAYGRVLKIEAKGSAATVDETAELLITDADGRIIYELDNLDFGTDDSTTKETDQGYSTVGLALDVDAVARSPLDITISTVDSANEFQLNIFVEV